MYLAKLGTQDYSLYQRCIRRLEHDVNIRGQLDIPKPVVDDIIGMNKKALLPKTSFISAMRTTDIEAYCLRNENDDNMGIVYMHFKDGGVCYIVDFGIFSEYKEKGVGTEFFNMLLKDVIEPRQCSEITLRCPYLGAQQFYLKMGFKFVNNKERYSGNPVMRKKLR